MEQKYGSFENIKTDRFLAQANKKFMNETGNMTADLIEIKKNLTEK